MLLDGAGLERVMAGLADLDEPPLGPGDIEDRPQLAVPARLLVVGVFLLAVILLYRYLKFFRHYAVEVYTTYAETE